MKEIKRIVVLGAGIMGHGFAQVFAAHGLEVTLIERDRKLLDRGLGWIRENLEYLVELGRLEPGRVEGIMARIKPGLELEPIAPEVDYVLEAVSENMELKREVFGSLGRLTGPEVILASNTSSYDINDLAAVTKHPERVIGTHWFHPPPITPCVEVIPGQATSPEVLQATFEFMERIGKTPTVCRSAPGFVANRIQLAMVAEALALVEEGLAEPKDIDRIVKTSFGFRLGAYGPFEIIDQAGADTYRAVYEYLYRKLNNEQFKPSPVLDRLVREKRFGLKTQKGFYDYGQGAAEAMKRDRDKKFYARLKLHEQEQKAG